MQSCEKTINPVHPPYRVETVEGNLSEGMRQLNGVYTQCVNRTRRRVGHVFQGRFKGILVEKDSYLLELQDLTPMCNVLSATNIDGSTPGKDVPGPNDSKLGPPGP